MRRKRLFGLVIVGLICFGMAAPGPSNADPLVDDIAPPLPVIVAGPSNWQPKFPYPFDASRNQVTDGDINAEREMCQWYNAQYDALIKQIDRFNTNLTRSNGDYTVENNQAIADAVTANIDQSEAYLAPRAQALTLTQDYLGDDFFPLYQGESFFRLWQHLSNVSAGIHGRQPAWFVGPSLQRAKRWGSRIGHSHVCD
ncbi:hypothetical protein MHEL_09170 [Mycolicibacterium helvum]|uniref:Uncharacterized protein n=2 Tax=Mycolicibacterium helvum TaxID=1534349 RepID=A0A7I7T030_9MYCO|nr:hypothetical protein MHEL_09170 [Mycolicibacterium helvum]